MTGRAGVYTVKELAPGSFDVLLDGSLIAALTHSIDGLGGGWRIDLLSEISPSECPPPFESQSHIFVSQQAALEWLGIGKAVAAQKTVPQRRATRAVPQYRAHLSPSERYRLRLLAEHSRFYAKTTGLGGLIARGFITPTGRTDEDGRAEWIITDAGRSALTGIEP